MRKLLTWKRVLGMMLSIAIAVACMPTAGSNAFAKAKTKSSGKVQMVTKAKDNAGNTTTYKYNKKGLVSKAVKKLSYKENDSDRSITCTTSFKYNKKNRISKKTSVKTDKTTTYEMDKTSGQKIKSTQGTITTTTKSVTTYKYNKKGLATSSVETTTTTKSGSYTTKDPERNFGYDIEMKDGRLVAGYNDYDNKPASAYYVTGDYAKAIEEYVSTTTYRDNGNGTYTAISESTTNDQNYDYSYIGSDGKEYEDPDYAPSGVTIKEKRIKIQNKNKDIRKSKSEDLRESRTVITKTYKYDSKKRVKSVATTTTTINNETEVTSSGTDETIKPDGTRTIDSWVNNKKSVNSKTDVKKSTETYTYKKGLAKSHKYSNPGVENSTNVYTDGLPNYTSTDEAGNVYKRSGNGAEWARKTTTTVANGTKTTITEEKPYVITVVEPGNTYTYNVSADPVSKKAQAVKSSPNSNATTYKYDKQKNVASYKYSGTSIEWTEQRNETFGNTIYEGYDEEQSPTAVEVSITHTYAENGKNENAVKKGSTALKKSLTMISGRKSDRAVEPGYECNRVSYTLKAKSFSKKKKADVEAQQWSIQNGALNGFVGLSLGY